MTSVATSWTSPGGAEIWLRIWWGKMFTMKGLAKRDSCALHQETLSFLECCCSLVGWPLQWKYCPAEFAAGHKNNNCPGSQNFSLLKSLSFSVQKAAVRGFFLPLSLFFQSKYVLYYSSGWTSIVYWISPRKKPLISLTLLAAVLVRDTVSETWFQLCWTVT